MSASSTSQPATQRPGGQQPEVTVGDPESPPSPSPNAGVLLGVTAYLLWGLAPLYFKTIATVPAVEVLAHRVIWSSLLLVSIVLLAGRRQFIRQALADRRTRLTLCVTTLLIASNWLTFFWAVAQKLVLQASLGYYINPLLNVLLGMAFLHERLRPLQWLSVFIAAVGVAFMIVYVGTFPWVSFVLAFTFGVYGLLRKTVRADALTGLTFETTLLLPLAVCYVVVVSVQRGSPLVHDSVNLSFLLMLAGVVTIVPLLLFTMAARRMRYVTIGFIQYIAPTSQFLLAVLAFGEEFTKYHAVAFVCIWAALAIFTLDGLLRPRPVLPAAIRPTETGVDP